MDFLQILSGIMIAGALLCVFAAQILWEPSDDHHIYCHNIAILLLGVLIIVIPVVIKHLKVIDCFRHYLNAFTRHPLETTEEDEKWHNSLAIARLPRLTYSTVAPPPPPAAAENQWYCVENARCAFNFTKMRTSLLCFQPASM